MRALTVLLLAGSFAATARADGMSIQEYDAVRYQAACDYDTRCGWEKKDMSCRIAPEAKKGFETDKQKNRLMHRTVDLDRPDWDACAPGAAKADCKTYPSFETYLLKDPKCAGVQNYVQHKGKYATKK